MGRFDGRVLLVTGAAQGIGAAVARQWVEEGGRAALCDVSTGGDSMAADLGKSAAFWRLDVRDEMGWERIVAEVEERLGPIDALVNNAGIVAHNLITGFDLGEFENIMRVNLVGTMLGMKHVGRRMAGRRHGSIINMSSNQGIAPGNGMAAYASSKWAIRGLTRVGALEFGPLGVRVNAVCPGAVNTPMSNPDGLPLDQINNRSALSAVPARRVAAAQEIAQGCLFLASDAASYINGADLIVDGGMTSGRYLDFAPGAPS